MPFTAKLYDAHMDLSKMPHNSVPLAASVSQHSDATYHVVVHNLSSQGVLVESYHPLDVGAEVALDINKVGKMTAHVVWRDGAFYDCIFDAPIAPDKVRAKLTSTKVIWGNFPSFRPGAPAVGKAGRQITFPAEDVARATDGDDRFSPRARLAMIVGGALICWSIPIGVVLALVL